MKTRDADRSGRRLSRVLVTNRSEWYRIVKDRECTQYWMLTLNKRRGGGRNMVRVQEKLEKLAST